MDADRIQADDREVWVETTGVWLNEVFYLQPGRYSIRRIGEGATDAV